MPNLAAGMGSLSGHPSFAADLSAFWRIFFLRGAFPDAFDEHFGADVAEEGEGDPRDEPLE